MKKKIILFLSSLVLLTGCGTSSTPAENVATDNTGNNTTNDVYESSVIWAHEPDLKFSSISELEADTYWGINETTVNEDLGYSQQWDDTYKPEYEPYGYLPEGDLSEYFSLPAVQYYEPNSIAVSVDNHYGIYDYSGNALLKPFYIEESDSIDYKGIQYQPYTGFCVTITKPEWQTYVFTKDFKSMFPSYWGGIGGDPGAGYYILNNVLYRNMEVVKGTVIQDAHGHNCLVKIVSPPESADSYLPYGDVIGYAAYNTSGEHLHTFDKVFPLSYVNGFCSFTDAEPEYNYEERRYVNTGNLVIYNMTTFEPINDKTYDDAKWFESGFCPVKKGDKWGFVDENGKEVTDFIWDDVSTAYDGKAYVGINGVYGVIDLKENINQNLPITMETCYPNGNPEGKDVEFGEIINNSIGKVTVKVTNLNTRSMPSTDGKKCGVLYLNQLLYVFEIQEGGGYTWYRVAEDVWVADKNGQWLDYVENEKG